MASIRASGGAGLDTNRLRSRRTAVTLAAGASGTFEIIWTTPFTNTSYTATVSVQEGETSNTLRVDKIQGIAADKISVRVTNLDALQARSGTLHAIAIAD